eukprot:scaffold3307_cov371-Prasinococcus_capsulatus_cf.AAC.2
MGSSDEDDRRHRHGANRRRRKDSHRDRDSDRHRKRDRSTEREREGRESNRSDHKRVRVDSKDAPGSNSQNPDGTGGSKAPEKDPEAEKKKKAAEIEQRRQRMLAWQAQRRKDKGEEPASVAMSLKPVGLGMLRQELRKSTIKPQTTGWTLDEDADEAAAAKRQEKVKLEIEAEAPEPVSKEYDVKGKGKAIAMEAEDGEDNEGVQAEAEDDDVDPLDAFMDSMVNPEVERLSKVPATEENEGETTDVPKGGRRLPDKYVFGSDSEDDDEEEEEEEEETDAAWAKKMTGKPGSKMEKLGTVDHAQVEYAAFRKNFYIESKEISRMSEEDVKAYREMLGHIKIRGKNCPRPIKTWNQCGLPNRVLEVIRQHNFKQPLPIQAQAMPAIMGGRDTIGIAKTGSGKTLAFVLPMLRHVKDQPALAEGDGPIALIMAPTRELVQQIFADTRKFARVLNLRVTAVYGGSGVQDQIAKLKSGSEIVVATPGRFIDILCTSGGKITNLRRVTYFVLDEADRMFDMGFEPQIMRIIGNTRPDRQTVLFSATFPRQIEGLATTVLDSPLEIQAGGRSVVNPDIEQFVEVRPEEDRFLRVLELLGIWFEKGKTLIFVHSQDACDKLYTNLMKAGYPCLSLHGGKDQNDRETTLADFKSDVANVMVATSVAARGLDVKELRLVINYDCPNHLEDYVHRVGRTGRAGNKGTAVTFIGPDEQHFAPDIVKALEQSGQPVPFDLRQLVTEQNQMKLLGTAITPGSGFGGKGFKFNEEEDEGKKEARKAQMKEMGLGGDDMIDFEDEEGDVVVRAGTDKSALNVMQQQLALVDKGDVAAVGAAAGAAIQASLPVPQATSGVEAKVVSDWHCVPACGALDLCHAKECVPVQAQSTAQQMAVQIAQRLSQQGATPRPAPTQPSTPITNIAMRTALEKAKEIATQLNIQTGQASADGGDDSEHFESVLEINDFPQNVRWKVCLLRRRYPDITCMYALLTRMSSCCAAADHP